MCVFLINVIRLICTMAGSSKYSRTSTAILSEPTALPKVSWLIDVFRSNSKNTFVVSRREKISVILKSFGNPRTTLLHHRRSPFYACRSTRRYTRWP